MSDAASVKQQAFTQAEHVLKESERLFHVVWEYASVAMALSIPDGTVIAANPAYFHLYGFPQEQVIGKHFSIIFPQEQRSTAHELYDYMFQSPTLGPPFSGPIRRADGTERFVESRYHFLTHQDQRLAMISFVRDITEQKRVEEALWVSEEKLLLALEVGHMDSWDWDIKSNTIRWSAHLDPPSDKIGGDTGMSYRTFMELVHPQDRTMIDHAMRRAFEGVTDFNVEFRIGLANGKLRRTRIHGQVLHDEAGKPIRVIGIIMDVPEDRQGEEAY